MAKSITDSDTIPNDDDRKNKEEMFMHNGKIDLDKLGNTVARLHRKESVQTGIQKKMDETLTTMQSDQKMLQGQVELHIQHSNNNHNAVMTTINGDGTMVNPGIMGVLQETNNNVSELTKRLTGKPPTDRHAKSDKDATQPIQTNDNVITTRDILKFLGLLFAVLVPIVVAYFVGSAG